MTISIIGTGYIGLVSGAGFASLGYHVICVDVDEEKVNQINNYISPIYEPGLDELLKNHAECIEATTSYEQAIQGSDITFICVGTPSLEEGDIDLSFVDKATESIGLELKKKDGFHTVIVKSTVVPGTTINHIIPLLEKTSGKTVGKDFGVGMNPEFLKEGVSSNMLDGTIKINETQPLQLINILKKYIPVLSGKTIGVLGLAFKPETDDIRDSCSIPLIKSLLYQGASVKTFDPEAMNRFKKLFPDISYCDTANDVLDSDAICIATAWDEFKTLDYTGKLVIDGRRLSEVKETAEIYEGVCW